MSRLPVSDVTAAGGPFIIDTRPRTFMNQLKLLSQLSSFEQMMIDTFIRLKKKIPQKISNLF